MNPRLAKEFRPLLLPWCVAAFAAAGHLVAFADPAFAKGEFGSFLVGLAGVGFVTGVLVLSALPVGFELHDRTLMLLLSQPADRTHLWRKKLNAATFSVLALTIVHGVVSAATGHLSQPEALLYAAFAVTAICSVGYHTLAARSLIVGIASAAATPFAIALFIHLFVYYALGLNVTLSEEETIALIVIGCTAYSAFFLWFSRRQFTTLELKDAGIPRGAQIPERLVPRKLAELFHSQPTGAVANLIRKEFCLQRPIFLVSAIFTACWLLTLLVMILHPAWHDNCVATLHGLTGTQMVLMVILTGCVALGDDKSLGTAAWHLTLPVSARKQWATKLLVAAGTIIATAIVLPTLLAALTLFKDRVGLLAFHRNDDVLRLAIPCALVFLVSFWSASMVTNTVRAALTCMLALTCLVGCVMLGARVPEAFFISSPRPSHELQSGLIAQVIAHLQLSPDYFAAQWKAIVPYSILFVVLVLVVTMLIQSLTQFRRVQTRNAVKAKCAVVLAAITLGGSFWCVDLANSIQSQEARFRDALTIALQALPREKGTAQSGGPRAVTLQELEQTGFLSYTAKTWLRNARITVTPIAPSNQQFPKPEDLFRARYGPRFTFLIQFPDGRQFSWSQ